MSRRVKPQVSSPTDRVVEAGEFFAGVESLRAFLDRNLQDPVYQRRRLTRMAQELVRPRTAAELCLWLAEGTREAVGAQACSLALLEGGWHPWVISGRPQRAPPPELCAAISVSFDPAVPPAPRASGNDLMVPLAGSTRVPACLWLELEAPLAPASMALLGALAGTAGVMVEQELSVELLRRDPVTNLWGENAFLEQGEARLAAAAKERRPAMVLAVRLIGLDAVRATRGILAAQDAMRHLAAAGSEVWPQELLGMRFSILVVLLVGEEPELLTVAVGDRLRSLTTALQRRTAEPGPPLAVATVCASVWPNADLRRLVEHLCRQAENVTTSGVRQLGE